MSPFSNPSSNPLPLLSATPSSSSSIAMASSSSSSSEMEVFLSSITASTTTASAAATINNQGLKVIRWDEFQKELARLWTVSATLKKAQDKKDSLSLSLHSLTQVRSESLRKLNELEELRQKLEERKLKMGNLLVKSKTASEEIKFQGEQLSLALRLQLVAAKALSMAFNQLQEANTLLAGERGHVHLKNLQKMLRMRQQFMSAQVSALYPVKYSLGPAAKVQSNVSKIVSGDGSGSSATNSKTNNPGMSSLTILGLQLFVPPLKKLNLFSDKEEVQRSATALSYVAHAVHLLASYLDVPLRYPLRLGGSRSYISDYSPSFETALPDVSTSVIGTDMKAVEFPLFLEGQDTTKAAYAIFLLNKDIEQLLNFIGVRSLGPRHVLANLKELFRTIQSQEYLDS